MSAPRVVLADANILLRFLRNDHPTHSPAARTVIEAATNGEILLRVLEVVVVDVFYTLTAPRMGVSRVLGARHLASLLQQIGFEVQDLTRVLDILGLCEANNIDYCDAALIVAARNEQLPILSYDHDFAKAPEVKSLNPIEWIKARESR